MKCLNLPSKHLTNKSNHHFSCYLGTTALEHHPSPFFTGAGSNNFRNLRTREEPFCRTNQAEVVWELDLGPPGRRLLEAWRSRPRFSQGHSQNPLAECSSPWTSRKELQGGSVPQQDRLPVRPSGAVFGVLYGVSWAILIMGSLSLGGFLTLHWLECCFQGGCSGGPTTACHSWYSSNQTLNLGCC